MFAALTLQMLLACLATGAVAGLLAGLLGIGGGLIIVPVLALLLVGAEFPPDALMHVAVATSLASIMFTGLSSTLAHARRGAVAWREAGWLAPGIVAGAAGGAALAAMLSSDTLRVLFGVFECLVAWQLLREYQPPARAAPAGAALLAGAGAGIGACSTILGIGGGVLTVPLLLWFGFDMRRAVATSAACGVPIAVAGTCSMIIAGSGVAGLAPGSTGYVYWPAALSIALSSVLLAPLGARLAHRLPVTTLRRLFALLLAVVGVSMLQ